MHRKVLQGLFGLQVSLQRNGNVLRTKVALSVREVDLTSPFCHKNYAHGPEHKLTEGDDRKPDGDRNVFHRHGVHPTITFSEVNSGTQNREGS